LEPLDLIPDSGRLLDVGSGGGFPAIPLALARPGLTVLSVESNTRKSAFLARVSRETSAPDPICQVINARVEELGPEHNRQYDLITARAVTEFPELIDWTQRLLAPRGRWLLWKGRGWRKEGDPEDYGLELLEERPLSDGGRLLVLIRANN
jgi:16S rRNA (guanine527-N7)-methyltransferase